MNYKGIPGYLCVNSTNFYKVHKYRAELWLWGGQDARARTVIFVVTRPIRAKVVSVAAGNNDHVPMIVLKGWARCNTSLDLPLPTGSQGGDSRDSSSCRLDKTVLPQDKWTS